MDIFIGPILLITLVCIECFILWSVKKVKIPWNEIIMNLNSGHIIMWLFRGGELYIYYLIYNHLSFNLLDSWSNVAYIAFTFFAWDFSFYWLHRLHHKIKLLWFVHEVHHQGEHFNISLGIRNSWFSSITSIPFFIPLALIGVNTEVFLMVSSIHYFIQFYNHTALVKNSGFLEIFMITPALHKVHHAINPEYIDKNCGGTLNIWDRLFGTYQPEIDNVPIKLGLKDKYETNNPFWINIVPFSNKKNLKEKAADNFMLFLATLLIFIHFIVYIKLESQETNIHTKFSLILSIFLSTLAIGGIIASKRWAVVLWVFIVFILNWVNVIFSGNNILLLLCSLTLLMFTLFQLFTKQIKLFN